MEKFSVPVLFTRIFIPTAFLLVRIDKRDGTPSEPMLTLMPLFNLQVCIVHLHYFHEPFLRLTDLKTVVDTHNSTITR